MKKLLIIVLLVLLSIASTSQAQTATEEIRFAAGATNTTVSSSVSGTTSRVYSLYAFAGQQMDMTVSAGSLTVVSPTGQPLVRGNVAGVVQNFSTILPETGNYSVIVSVPAGTGTTFFNLFVSIVGSPTRKVNAERINFLPGATSGQVNGWVTGTSPDIFVLYAFAGQRLETVLNLNQGGVLLMSPSGATLFAGMTPTQTVVLPETGDYTLRVSVPSGTALTAYTLTVSIDALPNGNTNNNSYQRIQFAAGAISGTVTGAIDASHTDTYVLYAFAGQQMEITFSQLVLMTVVAPSGMPLAIGLQSQPNATGYYVVTLPQTGDYHITINAVNLTGSMDYSMTVTITGTPQRTTQAERINFAPGTYGTYLTGSVHETQSDTFVLYAFAGQQMTINVTGAYLTVVSPSGIPMVRAQNGVVDFNGILPETGDYTVRVEVSVGTGWVDYSLGVTII